MTAILGYIKDMLPSMLMALPFIILIRVFYHKIRKSKQLCMYHEIGVVLFLLFMIALFSQTILTFLYTGPAVNRSFATVNLVPFNVFHDTYYAVTELHFWHPLIINFFGNICIFMPIGFMVPLLWSKCNRLWKVALIGFSISLFIETTQLTQARSSDIDDLWLNTVGSMLGYGTYYFMNKYFPHIGRTFKKS
ncbi:VanZ family protein [Sporosarcina sp. FSL K6-1522]|uniref:VanZ family protein n=1 Tax=Sporosarcina sp. FSL K6-1522 TaxID=2921554 RepID=UPI00315B1D92